MSSVTDNNVTTNFRVQRSLLTPARSAIVEPAPAPTPKLRDMSKTPQHPLSSGAYFDGSSKRRHRAVRQYEKTCMLQSPHDRARRRVQNGRQFSVAIYNDMVQIKSLDAIGAGYDARNGGGGLRGTVSGFSAASRKRMIEFIAATRYNEHVVFATFTYPDKYPVGDVEAWKRHFEALRRRFERAYPSMRVIWRMELAVRQSGTNYGNVAPHYHMLIWTGAPENTPVNVVRVHEKYRSFDKVVSPISASIETTLSRAWYEIVASNDENHLHHGVFVVACRNKRQAYSYVSKYVAKEANDIFEVGRRWGRIGTFDTTASRVGYMSGEMYIQFRRLVRRWLQARGKTYARKLARMDRNVGMTALGLGDNLTNPLHEVENISTGTIYRMLRHAAQLVGAKDYSYGKHITEEAETI